MQNNLNEASGVGIINVPEALLKHVQKYVCSVLLTNAYEVYKQTNDQVLLNHLKKFQQKYNASVLSSSKLKQLTNSINTIKLPKEEIYNSLPQNIKNNPKTKELIDNLTMNLIITNQLVGRGGSSAMHNNHNTVEIDIPTQKELERANTQSIIHSIEYSASAIEHELQHTIQQAVYRKLNSKDRQAQQHSDYVNDEAAYQASGIEFGPMVKDIVNRCKLYLETKLDTDKSKIDNIKDSIQYSISTLKQGKIIKFLRDYKQNKDANKALKLIYSKVSDFYDTDLQKEYPELNSKENDSNVSDVESNRYLDYPEAGESILGDLWLAYYREYEEKPKGLGSNYNELETVIFERPDFEAEISINGNEILVSIRTGKYSTSFNFSLPKDRYKILINNLSFFNNLNSVKKLKDKIEEEIEPSVDLEKTEKLLKQMKEDASYFNDDPNIDVVIDFDSSEGNILISFKGARSDMFVQDSNKNYYVIYNEQGTVVKQKDFISIMNTIIDYYYDYGSSKINKILRYAFSETPRSIDDVNSYIEYLKELEKENLQVQESSMRSLIDFISNTNKGSQ